MARPKGIRLDVAGQKNNLLTAIRFVRMDGSHSMWLCRCDCGKRLLVRVSAFRNGQVRSCGRHQATGPKADLTGRTFGRWTVVRLAVGAKDSLWLCRCKCGTTRRVSGHSLKRGRSRSCGCLFREVAKAQAYRLGKANIRHGMTGTVEHNAWHAMLQRCYDKNCPSYKNYGGRGIKVCRRWRRFEEFLADMGRRPKNSASLGRIDNSKNYDPTNCRWENWRAQQRNRRGNIQISFRGKTRCISEWAEEYGLSTPALWSRIQRRWPMHRALNTPLGSRYTRDQIRQDAAAGIKPPVLIRV